MADIDLTPESADFPLRFVPQAIETADGKKIFDLVRFDQSVADADTILAACSNPATNKKAAIIKADSAPSGDWDRAVYVIQPRSKNVAKIGVTRNPVYRLTSLQNGNFERLKFTHLFWMPRADAYRVEQLALRVFASLGRGMVGEWVKARPSEAAAVIVELLQRSTIPFSSSAMLVQNIRNVFPSGGSSSLSNRASIFREVELLSKLDAA